jgi:hypothetical protein
MEDQNLHASYPWVMEYRNPLQPLSPGSPAHRSPARPIDQLMTTEIASAVGRNRFMPDRLGSIA